MTTQGGPAEAGPLVCSELLVSVAEVELTPLDHPTNEPLAVRLCVRAVVSVAHVEHGTIVVECAKNAACIPLAHDHELSCQLTALVVPGPSFFCEYCHPSH